MNEIDFEPWTLIQPIYFAGGSDPRTPGDILLPSSKTFALDLTSKEWKRVADMTVARMDHCACSLSGMIYAIGGRGLHNKYVSYVSRCEKYCFWCAIYMHVPQLQEANYYINMCLCFC